MMTAFASRSVRSQALRTSVLGLFGREVHAATLEMERFDKSDWRSAVRWLDTSGLALYLLARMKELDIEDLLPAPLLVRLRQNLADNHLRTEALLSEMKQLTIELDTERVPFAFLKGLTLAPSAIRDPALRYQMDLDLVAWRRDASTVKTVLERSGYQVQSQSDTTWEFKTPVAQLPRLEDLYKIREQRVVEVHWVDEDYQKRLCRNSVWPGQLCRSERRSFRGATLPSLAAADLFLNQAVHLFGHLRGEHTRASWILELAHHVRAREQDMEFWEEVERLANDEVEGAALACAASLLLVDEVLGVVPPANVSRWMSTALPSAVAFWVRKYGIRAAACDAPGSKLYLLLERAIAAEPARRVARRRLVPLCFPPMVLPRNSGETRLHSLERYVVQFQYALFRLRFHIVEGVRYGYELATWRRLQRHELR